MNVVAKIGVTCILGVGLIAASLAMRTGEKSYGTLPSTTIQTSSGKRLKSVFDGITRDIRYPSLKARLNSRNHPSVDCDGKPGTFTRAMEMLGISEVIVHAQSGCSWSCCPVGGTSPVDVLCPNGCGQGEWTQTYESAPDNIGDEGAGTDCTGSCSSYCVATQCQCPSSDGEGDTGDTG